MKKTNVKEWFESLEYWSKRELKETDKDMLIDIKLMKEISQRAYLRVLKREGTSSLENIFESLASATKPDLVE